MKQIFYIIQREVVTSMRKKSSLLFTILSPVIFLLPFIFILLKSSQVDKPLKIAVIDDTHKIFDTTSAIFIDGTQLKLLNGNLEYYKSKLISEKSPEFGAIIDLPGTLLSDQFTLLPIRYYTTSIDGISSKTTYDIERFINAKILHVKLQGKFLNQDSISKFTNLKKLYTIYLDTNKNKTSKLASMLAYVIGMLMYLIFIIFNNSLLRGVMEEKSNRIVEVFSMVVNPFNLMIGKILGVGCFALVQLFTWIILSIIYMKGINYVALHFFNVNSGDNSSFSIAYIFDNYKSLPLIKILIFTPIFFIFGFLVNGAITTVVGATASLKGNSSLSIISNIINIGSIYIAMFSAGYPDNLLAKAAIYIPFFSPIVLPALLPYNLPLHVIIISLIILIISFFLLVYLAGKIYRISIISYGNKISLKEIFNMVKQKRL